MISQMLFHVSISLKKLPEAIMTLRCHIKLSHDKWHCPRSQYDFLKLKNLGEIFKTLNPKINFALPILTIFFLSMTPWRFCPCEYLREIKTKCENIYVWLKSPDGKQPRGTAPLTLSRRQFSLTNDFTHSLCTLIIVPKYINFWT